MAAERPLPLILTVTTALLVSFSRPFFKKHFCFHPPPPSPSIHPSIHPTTDEQTRAAYDRVLAQKQAAKARVAKFDESVRRAREDLEARESDAKRRKTDAHEAAKRLEQEIKRLRAEV